MEPLAKVASCVSRPVLSETAGTQRLEGAPVGVHEVLDYHNEKTFPNLMDVVNHFNEGRKHYKTGDFQRAISSFNDCLKSNPNDNLSKTYIDRCNLLIKENPENWDGIWVMKSK